MLAFLGRLFGRLQGPTQTRDRGRPPSPNGASSFHLVWEPGPSSFDAVRATLEITSPPRTDDLYFFALQASFVDGGSDVGGAHIGLQWNRRHPGSTAANWGGYWSQGRGGAILPGTESSLPSAPDDPNTRDYAWAPGVPYQLQIEPGSHAGWWLGTITDIATGVSAPIRELQAAGDRLRAPMVWCEVFARCDAPSVAVAWTDLAVRVGADWVPTKRVRTNYQTYGDGGCTNTNSAVDGATFLQTTATERVSGSSDLLQQSP